MIEVIYDINNQAVKKEEEDALNYKIKPIEIPLSTKIPQYNSLL